MNENQSGEVLPWSKAVPNPGLVLCECQKLSLNQVLRQVCENHANHLEIQSGLHR